MIFMIKNPVAQLWKTFYHKEKVMNNLQLELVALNRVFQIEMAC